MNQESNFADLVLSKFDPNRTFEVQVYYDRDGDCIEFITSNEDFFAERIDSLVTVYYGRESKQVIGSLIKGVHSIIQAILEKLPGFKIEVADNQVVLEHLFTARMWSSAGDEPAVLTYRKLRDVARETGAVAELCAV
jgi:hypothetical protein